jgi:hypothetical protein
MSRPQAMAGVVRPVRVPTTPRWLEPALSPPYPRRGVFARTYVAVFGDQIKEDSSPVALLFGDFLRPFAAKKFA